MATKPNKTQATEASVEGYLAAIASAERRADCAAVAAMMEKHTGHAAKMWGPSIVGYDSVHYRYESGREGDMPVVGFSSRKDAIVVYVMPSEGPRQAALLEKLGKHSMGKSCLYVKRLADVDVDVLEKIIADTVKATRRLYPKTVGANGGGGR